ncbi:MAG: choice-of-anchor Q domain-containing protein, partial [Anaerolineae bacterium]
YAGLPPGPNDISADPLFRNQAGDDYHLCAGSPLIDAGTNQGAPATDIDGDVRPYDGDNEGVAVTDIGADEWLPGPAFLTVLPSTLNFVGTVGKQDPKPQGIDIFNCGSRDTFQWTANTDAPWLHVCPLSGVTTGTATVFVDTGGLGMGRYTGTITVTSQTAGVLNSPQAISTTLEVVPLGDIDADCDVDVTDVMEVVSRWRLQAGDPNYLAACDVNDDKTINVADIQKVVTQWGIICPQGYSVTRAAPKATDEQSWCGQHLLGDRNH